MLIFCTAHVNTKCAASLCPSTRTHTHICIYIYVCIYSTYKHTRTHARLALCPSVVIGRSGINWTRFPTQMQWFSMYFLPSYYSLQRAYLYGFQYIYASSASCWMTSSCKPKLETQAPTNKKKLANFRLIFLSNLHFNLWCSFSSAVCLLHCAFYFFIYFWWFENCRKDKFCQNCLIYTTLVTFFTRHCICVSDSLKERCKNLTLI